MFCVWQKWSCSLSFQVIYAKTSQLFHIKHYLAPMSRYITYKTNTYLFHNNKTLALNRCNLVFINKITSIFIKENAIYIISWFLLHKNMLRLRYIAEMWRSLVISKFPLRPAHTRDSCPVWIKLFFRYGKHIFI